MQAGKCEATEAWQTTEHANMPLQHSALQIVLGEIFEVIIPSVIVHHHVTDTEVQGHVCHQDNVGYMKRSSGDTSPRARPGSWITADASVTASQPSSQPSSQPCRHGLQWKRTVGTQ
jgi:hypothetical protein